MMFYTYIIRLSSSRFYTGSTQNLKQRLAEHKRGKVLATKNEINLKLSFYAAFESMEQARQFGKYLKSSSGKAFRNRRLISSGQ